MTTIGIGDGRPKDPCRLRELAAWYREFAERAGDPVIWEARLRTAAELEREADRLEKETPAGASILTEPCLPAQLTTTHRD
jgi:hypothetical protein